MHVAYKPEDPTDGEPREWKFDPSRIKASQAEVIENRFGENFDQWVAGVQSGNMRARRVLLWHLLTRDHATLRFEDTPDFYAGELEVSFDVAELVPIRERMAASNLPASKRDAALAAIDLEMTQAMEREAGKAEAPANSSPTSPGDGGSTS